MNKIRLAIIGIRGIPACYGGFETFAENLAPALVQRGHDVTVYGRRHVIDWDGEFYKGVRLVLLPAVRHKYLETITHTLVSIFHILFFRWSKTDVVLVCNGANSPFIWLLRLFGIPVTVNVDGIERKRAKWNRFGKLWYLLGEISSVCFSSKVISDAEVIRCYYLSTYGRDSEVIPYGFSDAREEDVKDKLSHEPIAPKNAELFSNIDFGNYILYVSRLEPENNAHVVIEAYEKLSSPKMPLLIVGDAPYAEEYKERLRILAGPNVKFLGFKFGEDYLDLQLGAYIYIQATEVGGTHPALVEAMGFGNAVIANETEENLEVLGEAGLFYFKNDSSALSKLMEGLLQDREAVDRFRKLARERAEKVYSWPVIISNYEALLQKLIA